MVDTKGYDCIRLALNKYPLGEQGLLLWFSCSTAWYG